MWVTIEVRVKKMLPKRSQRTATSTPSAGKSPPVGKSLLWESRPLGEKTSHVRPKIETCVICCQKVTEKEEVMFCTGGCNGPLHRYCAGVSLVHFESMKVASDSASQPNPAQQYRDRHWVPFLCLVCSQQVHKDEVQELK